MTDFRFNEKYLSQIPALQLLINLGYEYLPPDQALAERQGKAGNVLLEGILGEQLKRINRIHYKGDEYLFSEENIQTAVQKLKNIRYDGLQKTNEAVYDLLTLGTALEQSIEGNTKSFDLHYIDWRNIANNVFHVTAEYSVERTRSHERVRPDIVLFVNGIPLVIIECKSPKIEVEEAVKQNIRNQNEEYIPRLFSYAQLLLALNKNAARYATAGTPLKFWALWREQIDAQKQLQAILARPLKTHDKERLFSHEFSGARSYFDGLEKEGRHITEQDRAVHSLCRPERLLELVYRFTLFDAGIKKIARYQQYFAIKRTLNYVKTFDAEERRQGGIIWHTQGSGKSITMVLLARNLALDEEIPNPRILLVTDRIDLDKQLKNTFAACGLDPQRAKTGRDLLELVTEKQAGIVSTLVHKFDKALKVRNFQDDSPDIFMLVDEAHRSQYREMAARMRQMFPRACYLGFTGTPLTKAEKNSFRKFGRLIDSYDMEQAVKDGAVVPLLYEGRHAEMTQNKETIDLWFERHTQGLSREQKADLKKKHARAETLNKVDRVVYMRAFDISEHYRENWQGTGFKAQLVAPDKDTALRYQRFLDEIGYVSCEVVISAPDARLEREEVEGEATEAVYRFWDKMMQRYGSEEEYNKQLINQFKYGDDPEILIVVHKLLTGFDAPRNTVLYLCRDLKEHTLLQAVARVNRLYEDPETETNKDFGYIVDYVSILGELDKAMTMYRALADYDEDDLRGTLKPVQDEIVQLPQRYSDLWDLFKEVRNSRDEEAFERHLEDDARREDFYERLAEYSKTLALALSTETFIMDTPDQKLSQYKGDLKRFQNLKAAVKLRYQEAIDYRDYERKIKKLLDTHVAADEVLQLNEPVNIFDEHSFGMVKEEQGVYQTKSTEARADAIAHATKKAITENMDKDPAFYEKFSRMIQQVIDDFRARRISDLEYLNRANDIRDRVVNREHDDLPEKLRNNDDAMAVYGVVGPLLVCDGISPALCEDAAVDTALAVQEIFRRHWKVHFWDDPDAQKRVTNDIDDYLYDEVKERRGIPLDLDRMDEILEKVMQLARHRMPE